MLLKSGKTYALRCALIVFFVDAIGRIVGCVLQARGGDDNIKAGWATYNFCVGVGFFLCFAFFAWAAKTKWERNIILTMEYFVVWAAWKELALNPSSIYIWEAPLSIYFICVAVKYYRTRKHLSG